MMDELYIDGNNIEISKSAEDEISLHIENSLDNITINMTKEEVKILIRVLLQSIK